MSDYLMPASHSACCGARVYIPDICTDCGEHCSVETTCDDCDGSGLLNNCPCPTCDGKGFTIED